MAPYKSFLQGLGEPAGSPSQNRGTGRATVNGGVSGAAACRRRQKSQGEWAKYLIIVMVGIGLAMYSW